MSTARELVLHELQEVVKQQAASFDGLDNKLRDILTVNSLIFSIVSLVQFEQGELFGTPGEAIISLAILGLYIGMIATALRGMHPRKFNSPISGDWEELAGRFFPLNETEAIELLINNHLSSIQENAKPIEEKAMYVQRAMVFLIAIPALLLLKICLS